MRIEPFRIRQFSAPDGFSGPSFGGFTEIHVSMRILSEGVDEVPWGKAANRFFYAHLVAQHIFSKLIPSIDP